MSNDRTDTGASSLPFLVVEYEEKAAAVSRNTNYQETLASVKRVFHLLRNAKDEDLGLNAHLEEVDKVLRIDNEIWSELLPRLTSVRVELDGMRPEEPPTKSTKLGDGMNKGVMIHLHRRAGWDWGHDVVQIYTILIPLDRTGQQLVELVKQQEHITATRSDLRYNGGVLSRTATLAESGIDANSLVEILMA